MFNNKLSVYILKLKQGKYYVGKSINPLKRFQEHLDGKGAVFTKKYQPLNIEKIYENVCSYDEDKYVKKYMYKYGIDNVRGGSYCNDTLTEYEKILINKELDTANNKCYICGHSNHFAKYCLFNN